MSDSAHAPSDVSDLEKASPRRSEPHSSPNESSGSDQPAGDDRFVIGMSAGDRRVTLVLVCAAMGLMIVNWYRLTQSRPGPIQLLHADDYVFELNVNQASWVEWMQLDQIGETLARRIVADREKHGPFESVDDVQRVPGVGPKTLEALRGHLTCKASHLETESSGQPSRGH